MSTDREVAHLYEKIRMLEARLEESEHEHREKDEEIKLLRALLRKWVNDG